MKRSPSTTATYQAETRSGIRCTNFSVHLAIFAAGALLMTAFLNYEAVPDRSAMRQSVLGPGGAVTGRRGLYTSSSGGEWA